MSVIELLDAFWTRCHEQRVQRAEEARQWVINKRKFTPWAEELLLARDKVAKQCQIIGNVQKYVDQDNRTLQIEAKVQGPDFFEPRGKLRIQPENWNKHPEWQKVHIVKVHERTCTCGLYQEYLLPCCHALVALYASKIGLHDGFDLIPSWYKPISVLTAYDYLFHGLNEFGEDVVMHTGLRAIDITHLEDFTTITTDLDEDPFADLVVEPPAVSKKRGRRPKRREAGDGKGPFQKVQKPQVYSVCYELGHNKKRCKELIRLEGNSIGIGII
jgi:hypothetical protein